MPESLTVDDIPLRLAFELFDNRLNQQLTSLPAASRHFQRSAEQRMRGRPLRERPLRLNASCGSAPASGQPQRGRDHQYGLLPQLRSKPVVV